VAGERIADASDHTSRDKSRRKKVIVCNQLALLIPFPMGRIEVAYDVCAREGMVAFGSDKDWFFWDALRKDKGDSLTVQTLIYMSHQGVPTDGMVSWTALLENYTAAEPVAGSEKGVHRNLGRNRPLHKGQSWTDPDELFLGYMELVLLRQLNRPFPIRTLVSRLLASL